MEISQLFTIAAVMPSRRCPPIYLIVSIKDKPLRSRKESSLTSCHMTDRRYCSATTLHNQLPDVVRVSSREVKLACMIPDLPCNEKYSSSLEVLDYGTLLMLQYTNSYGECVHL